MGHFNKGEEGSGIKAFNLSMGRMMDVFRRNIKRFESKGLVTYPIYRSKTPEAKEASDSTTGVE